MAGCFVMICNIPKEKMTAREVLKTYKEQYGVEQNFSFLKEPLIANDTFLKKPSRIEALTFILLVSLMIWNLIQRELRNSEEVRNGELNDLIDLIDLINASIPCNTGTQSCFLESR